MMGVERIYLRVPIYMFLVNPRGCVLGERGGPVCGSPERNQCVVSREFFQLCVYCVNIYLKGVFL